ncbi:FRIGIDA-like protein 4b [Phragmites australis]|uniref:FRIGIDA-like protein 4b n=1 Tax=Phragmites australis TaxID=29695 RepID=UPI002D76C872|nr:FRIGIDA-like protein 4b [Phragmites australis]
MPHNEMNERELSALKAVIKCIEEHKLDEQYPIDPLQKRVIQLEEKARADKKRAVQAAKPHSPRGLVPVDQSMHPVLPASPKKASIRQPKRQVPYPYERQFVYSAGGPSSYDDKSIPVQHITCPRTILC